MSLVFILSILFFLILEILIIIRNIKAKEYNLFWWFCDFAPILFAISFSLNNAQFTKGIINVGLLTQSITLILLIIAFISGKDILGSKKALARGKFFVITEILIHATTIIALILTYNIKPELQSLTYSLIIIVIMFFLTLIYTPKEENVNLLYNLGISLKKKSKNLRFPFQNTLWIFYFLVIALITFLIQKELYLFWGS